MYFFPSLLRPSFSNNLTQESSTTFCHYLHRELRDSHQGGYKTQHKHSNRSLTSFCRQVTFYTRCSNDLREFLNDLPKLWLCCLQVLSASRCGEAHPKLQVTSNITHNAVRNFRYKIYSIYLKYRYRDCEPRNCGWVGAWLFIVIGF